MKCIQLLSFLGLSILVVGCGSSSFIQPEPVTRTFPFDGVKFLSAQISDGSDPGSMIQPEYQISDSQRLLIRLENFVDKRSEVLLSGGKMVTANVTLMQASDATLAQSSFKVCPLTKNWMMLATWRKAYPMGTAGTWSRAGGDYDPASCIAVTAVTDQAYGTKVVAFDVTPWFVNFVNGRQINYGLELISSSNVAISIKGDADAYSAPSIQFNSY